MARSRFDVRLTRPAEKDFRRIDRQYHEQIRDGLDRLEANARPADSESLTGREKGYFRLTTGEYRIVYSIDYERGIVYITRIRHRGEVYR